MGSNGSFHVRSAWQDRFRAPSVAVLLEAVGRQHQPACEHARSRLTASGCVSETLAWRGVWNWTFVYACSQCPSGFAFLIPDPTKPRLCVAVPDDALGEIPPKKLPRMVRDGLALAPAVDGTRWPVWDVTSKAQVDEVLCVLDLRTPWVVQA